MKKFFGFRILALVLSVLLTLITLMQLVSCKTKREYLGISSVEEIEDSIWISDKTKGYLFSNILGFSFFGFPNEYSEIDDNVVNFTVSMNHPYNEENIPQYSDNHDMCGGTLYLSDDILLIECYYEKKIEDQIVIDHKFTVLLERWLENNIEKLIIVKIYEDDCREIHGKNHHQDSIGSSFKRSPETEREGKIRSFEAKEEQKRTQQQELINSQVQSESVTSSKQQEIVQQSSSSAFKQDKEVNSSVNSKINSIE